MSCQIAISPLQQIAASRTRRTTVARVSACSKMTLVPLSARNSALTASESTNFSFTKLSRNQNINSTRRSAKLAVRAVQAPEKVDEKTSGHRQNKRRVVVTGMGVVSPVGHDIDTFYDNLLAGKSGISKIEKWDASELPTHFAGEIKELDCTGYITRKMERRLDPYIKYLLVAAKKGLEHSGLSQEKHAEAFEQLDLERCGALIGSAMGGFHTTAATTDILNTEGKGVRKINPFCIPFAITNMGSALFAIDTGFMGPNYSCASACASGNQCIMNAMQHIQRGEADLMVAGASDACVLPIGMAGFNAAKALSKRNDAPTKASRPWDTNRDGFVMGEGAGVLILEDLEHAKKRGAKIYAEVLGGSYTCDAHHMTEPKPSGEGVTRCIELALEDAGVEPHQVNYVNAHATSTPAGDMAEYRAVQQAFKGKGVDGGDHNGYKMNATKSLIGHLLGAAPAVEAIATVQAIVSGFVHPNLNLESPEPDVDQNIVVGTEKEKVDIEVAISNSFGFGGHNSCTVFGAFKE